MTTTHETKPSFNIGFIGLGDQGGPMARAIGDSGLKLHVWARRTRSLEAVAGVPHTAHASITALADACEVIGLCLRDDRDLWDILDRQGLLKALKPGAIVINHGTGDPDENRRIASYLDEVRVVFLDAPVSGGRPGAVARALTTFVGGDAAAFEQSQPVFRTFSTQAVHMGRSGSGQVAKLLNNALTMTNLKNAVDVFGLADKMGLNIARLFDAVSASSGSSAVLRALGTTITPGIAPHLQELMRKDMEHFADAMLSKGLDANEVVERGLAGANGLLDLVQRVTASGPNA